MRSLTILSTLSLGAVGAFQENSMGPRTHRLDVAFSLRSSLLDAPTTTSVQESSTTCDLPPLLRNIADERADFQMNLGRAMDVLRKDYPLMLFQQPDFSIFHDDISVLDPSGVQLTGLKNYKASFAFLQTLTKLFYSQGRSRIQIRMVYDFCRSSIRISWNVVLEPKMMGRPLYLDGISMYRLDPVSGKIIEHKIENLMMNQSPLAPPFVLNLLQREMFMQPQGVPAGVWGMIHAAGCEL